MLLRLPAVTQTLKQCYWAAAFTLLAGFIFVQLVPWQSSSSAANRLALAGEVCIVALATPYDPASGIGLHAPRAVPADARCPVCGMYPARAREWAAQIIFSNGDTHFFDSPLTLFIYLQDPGHYSPSRRNSEITASYVSDTSDTIGTNAKWIKASDAIYVSGSNAMGPMRAGNLPAFSSKAAAQRFAGKRGGELISARQISPQLLQSLNSARRHAHDQPRS